MKNNDHLEILNCHYLDDIIKTIMHLQLLLTLNYLGITYKTFHTHMSTNLIIIQEL